MARFFQGLFGSNKQTQPPAGAPRVQTSLQGVPIPLLLGGQARMTGNIIDYFGFTYTVVSSSGSGKGGISGGGGKGNSGNYNYFVSIIVSICEGPIDSLVSYWLNGKGPSPVAATPGGIPLPPPLAPNPFAIFLGTYTQAAWGFSQSAQPARTYNYRGLAYVASANYNLGSSPDLPSFSWEVVSTNKNAIPGQPDGDFSVGWTQFLTNQYWGLGFPSNRMGDLTQWQSYCLAVGFVMSMAVTSGVAASSVLNDMLKATNSEARWSGGLLSVVPYGDKQITAGTVQTITETRLIPQGLVLTNGTVLPPTIKVGFVGSFVLDQGVKYDATGIPLTSVITNPPSSTGQYCLQSPGVYVFNASEIGTKVDITYQYSAVSSYTPNNTPVYAFTLDDFLDNQGSIGQGVSVKNTPVVIVVKSRDQMLNNIKVEYLDRNANYNPVDIEVKDEASILLFRRERPSDIKQMHMFCLASAAQLSAALMLQREQIANTYQWTTGKWAIPIDVMDIVTLTNPGQGLVAQAVRVIEVQENSDGTLTFTGEEYPGTANAPLFGTQAALGTQANYNVDPGLINPPILFEPTDQLGGGLAIWAAISGINKSLWGGCLVFVSYDGANYSFVTQLKGPSRMGVTTADFPPVTPNPIGGNTIDNTNTLQVDLAESGGTLISVSAVDMTNFNSRCYVGPINGGGEIVAFQNATLVSGNKYNLTNLNRGGYSTTSAIVDHPSGSAFCRLDEQIAQIPFDQSRIGATISLKFLSFNNWQGGLQSLANVPSYPYTIQGSALKSPLPNPTNLRTYFESGFMKLYWDEITDFRNGIVYELRKGATWAGGLVLGTLAHPPFILFGNDTFWIAAKCQPVAGLTVYSATPQSVSIQGNVLVQNIVKTFDEQATGWTGIFSGGVQKDGADPHAFIRTGGSGNILTDPAILETLTTNAATASGNVLHFASVPGTIIAGMAVSDNTTPSAIAANTTVLSSTATTVTISSPVAGGGVGNGDTLTFATPDILNYGGEQSGVGYYEIPSSHWIDVGYVAPTFINASWIGQGIPVGQNILTIADFLNDPDVLGAANSQYVDVHLEIAVGQARGDIYTLTDMYAQSDIFTADVVFGSWQKFVPGTYLGRFFKLRVALSTIDPGTIAYCTAFSFSGIIAPRIDHYQSVSVPATAQGKTITFTPDNATAAAPFNGGPQTGGTPQGLPYINVTILNPQAGDLYNQISLSLSSLQFNITNGGSPVNRLVNIDVEGY